MTIFLVEKIKNRLKNPKYMLFEIFLSNSLSGISAQNMFFQ